MRISYIVWKHYQRRAEVLSPLLQADLVFLPNRFRQKYLRPIDYLFKSIATFSYLLQHQPDLVVLQSPPLIATLPALFLRIPYVLDAHNATVQDKWRALPFIQFVIRRAAAIFVHNSEILKLAETTFPGTHFITLVDPLEFISRSCSRQANQILVVCAFGSDEPIDVIVESIRQLPEYIFVITADVKKLSPDQRQQLCELENVRLTGFLPTEEYQTLLCSSKAALVLTTRAATQPSGACEALSSNTPLIISNTSLIKDLFGEWAVLVENSPDAIVTAIRSLQAESLDLKPYRSQWNANIRQAIQAFYSKIDAATGYQSRDVSLLSDD